MTQYGAIKIFEHKRVRSSWDAETETWYYSIVDVVGILTDQPDARHASNYWKVLKNRLAKEGCELVTNCNHLKLLSVIQCPDGLLRLELPVLVFRLAADLKRLVHISITMRVRDALHRFGGRLAKRDRSHNQLDQHDVVLQLRLVFLLPGFLAGIEALVHP